MSESDNNSSQSDAASMLSTELDRLFASDDISEENLRQIVRRHKFAPNNNLHVSDYEFFHTACCNDQITEGIIRCLLEYFPAAVNVADYDGLLPLHHACANNVSLGVIQLLIDAAPDSVRSVSNRGGLPLHCFCRNTELHQTTLDIFQLLVEAAPDSVRCGDNNDFLPLHCFCANTEFDEIKASIFLQLLLEKHPEAIQHASNGGYLPIHIAAITSKSPEFCRVLIDAYPGSGGFVDHRGMLPLQYACAKATLVTVAYLLERYPDAINHTTPAGWYPIHSAIRRLVPSVTIPNVGDAVNVVKFLLNCDPNVKFQEIHGQSLLVYACSLEYKSNIRTALEVIEAICEAHPESIRQEDNEGLLPLHKLCANTNLDETTAVAILRLLLEKYPESIRHESNRGILPIHMASMMIKSPEFCSVLIDAYPGSERIPPTNPGARLPFHCACMKNTIETVAYLYNLYPDAINHETPEGAYPIHAAIRSVTDRGSNPEAAVDIVKFLLDCDPRVKFQKLTGRASLFAQACLQGYNDSNIGAAVEIIEVIYDAHPEAIESVSLRIGLHPQMQSFVGSQLVYSRQANDIRLMTTPSEYGGQLPLHTALQGNVRLGSIKLLVKGNPLAVQSPDNRGALPLHIACMYHKSLSVVKYLVGLDTTTLDAVDHDDNTALHYACFGANYETIKLLLEKYDAVAVSKRNALEKLPIEVLWESDAVVDIDRESVEYTECLFQLLKSYPEITMNSVSSL
eukprot:scaffold1900_cov147-Skeletonema_menzelii.AAC.4